MPCPFFCPVSFQCLQVCHHRVLYLGKHLDSPAAWLHITDCSLAERSQCLTVSWVIVREAAAEGKLCLATLLNALFSFASSGDQEHTVDLSESLSVCIWKAWVFSQIGP